MGKPSRIPKSPKPLKKPLRPADKPFTVKEVEAAKAKPLRYLLWEPGGLVLEVLPSAKKVWRHRYTKFGKQHWYKLGDYPVVSLADARTALAEVKVSLAKGGDPAAEKKQARVEGANTFKAVALEWCETNAAGLKPRTAKQRLDNLTNLIFPSLGHLPIASISASVALQPLKRIEARGKHHTARRMLQHCVAIADYAIAKSVLKLNPFQPLRRLMKAETVRHQPAIIKPARFGQLLRAIDAYSGDAITRHGLQLLALFFVRPTELRTMRWTAVDFEARQWSLFATQRKEKRELVVPLARQAVEILTQLRDMTGDRTYVLGSRLGDKILSENTFNSALRRMGFSGDEHVAHGFRASARTMMNEVLRCEGELVELQLGREIPGPMSATYNRVERIDDRTAMMQRWADYLDELRGGKP